MTHSTSDSQANVSTEPSSSDMPQGASTDSAASLLVADKSVEGAAAKQPKPRWRRWGRRLVVAAVAAAIFAAFAPSLAGLGPVRAWIGGRLSKELQLQIQLGGVRAGWWRQLEVDEIHVATEAGVELGRLTKLQTSQTLWGLIAGGTDKGEIRLTHPVVRLDLTDEVVENLVRTVTETRTDRGLLGAASDPSADTSIRFVIEDAVVDVRPQGVDDWQEIVSECSPKLHLQRAGDVASLSIEPGQVCRFQVSPVLCDWGLQYVLPVLAGAVDADGRSVLVLQQCDLNLTAFEESEIDGQLLIESIRAKVEGPVLQAVTDVVVKLADQPDNATVIHLMEDCQVNFAMTEGRVYHEGLRFGLPRLLPVVGLETRGSIGLDETLDLYLETELPLDKLGNAPVLQKLGSPRLSVPIAGTLREPKVQVGDGRLAQGLVQDLVGSLTDEQVDAGVLLQQISELGLMEKILNRRRERQALEQAEEAEEGEQSAGASASEGDRDDSSAESAEDRGPGLFERIRKRGGLLRRRK